MKNYVLIAVFVCSSFIAACNNSSSDTDKPSNNNLNPVADNQILCTSKDSAIIIALTGSDADGDSLTFSYENPSYGTLSGNGADLTYTPNSGFSGADSFTFTVSDGQATSETATISITVDADAKDASGNNVCVANSQIIVTDQDTPVTITLTGSDADGDSLTFSYENPSYGTLSGNGADLTY
ncbi:MAG: hypothetical protein GY874_17770, partial [Desulfobacteraceae bacterium]|nr:hypothetical protein [Desulfobacteraceae bacterium]